MEMMEIVDLYSYMTSKEILNKSTFEEPYVILPKDFKTFGDLLKYREWIRDLKLVPIKDESERSIATTDKLVHGTFRMMKHIHFWYKNKSTN